MALGYSGFAQLMDGDVPVTLLVTSCSINPELNPIISSSAVGLGWKNAADSSHYSNGVRNYSGSVSFDMQGATVWDTINKWALTERVAARKFKHSPDGTRIYSYGYETGFAGFGASGAETNKYGAWCKGVSFQTGTDSVVGATVQMLALTREETVTGNGYFNNLTGTIGGDCSVFGATNPLNPTNYINTSPIPFWKTNARILMGTYGSQTDPDPDAETVSWDVNLENNTQLIKTCNGLSSDNYGVASAVVCGPMAVSGNIELYKHSGVWDPVNALTGNPIIAYTASFLVTIDAGSGTTLSVELPAIRLEGDAYDMNLQGPTNRKFSIKGMGGRCIDSVISAPIIMTTST